MSTSPTIIALPSTDDYYKYYERSYPIYITMRTVGDYDSGGIFYFTLSNGFIWDGACQYYP